MGREGVIGDSSSDEEDKQQNVYQKPINSKPKISHIKPKAVPKDIAPHKSNKPATATKPTCIGMILHK